MPLILLALLAAASQADRPLTDADLRAFASTAFGDKEKREWMFKPTVLGVHHSTRVVVDYPCSDLCPQYTRRIIHYAVEPGPACTRVDGIVADRTIPVGIGSTRRSFCIPKPVAEVEDAVR